MKVCRPLCRLFVLLYAFCSTLAFGFEFPDLSSNTTVRFLVMGDFGTGTSDQHRVARAMKRHCDLKGCDFVIGVGDNFYPFGVRNVNDPRFQTRFEQVYQSLGILPFWMSLGNHDGYGRTQIQVDYTERSQRWKMPAKKYEVPGLPSWVQLIGLNTPRMNRNQGLWLRQKVCSKKQGWKMVFGHHPVYSSGKHGDQNKQKRHLLPVIRDCGINVFFAGHDHHQEHIETPWFHQLIQGAAAKLRSVDRNRSRRGGRILQRFARSALGFAWIELSEGMMDVEFINAQAQQVYRTSIEKKH